jgi:hypothetical protein
MVVPSSSNVAEDMLTNNLLIRTILAGADVDEIEKYLSARETTNKVFEGTNLFDEAFTNQNLAKTCDICVNSADDARVNWNVLRIFSDVLLDGCMKLRGSAAASSLTMMDEVVGELASVSAEGQKRKLS